MLEFLWHGRGGQGAFTAARLLGAAYSLKNNNSYALAFPSFGPERRGAPIRSFTKLSDKYIGDRSEISKADYVVFLDDTLFSSSILFLVHTIIFPPSFNSLKADSENKVSSRKTT